MWSAFLLSIRKSVRSDPGSDRIAAGELLILRPEIRGMLAQGKVHVTVLCHQDILFQADGLLKERVPGKSFDSEIHVGLDLSRVIHGIST
jgi:hypothetical protein